MRRRWPARLGGFGPHCAGRYGATGEATAEPEISHEAPNDVAMARFLSTAKLVNNYVGRGPVDNGLRYRQFINIYDISYSIQLNCFSWYRWISFNFRWYIQ